MIQLAYLGESKKMEMPEEAQRLLIVRKPMGKIPKGFLHVPSLSPSLELFEKTQQWKAGAMTAEEARVVKLRPDGTPAWWALYEEAFQREMSTRRDMVQAVESLQKHSQQKDIYLFCYCKNLAHCHRLLIGKKLEMMGCRVNFRGVTLEENRDSHHQLSLFDGVQEGG